MIEKTEIVGRNRINALTGEIKTEIWLKIAILAIFPLFSVNFLLFTSFIALGYWLY